MERHENPPDEDATKAAPDIPSDNEPGSLLQGNVKIRLVALALLAIVISPLFGVTIPTFLQAFALYGNILYLIPFMAYLDEAVNFAWDQQPVRFLAVGRVVWILLVQHNLYLNLALFSALYQIAIHLCITALNYFLYHRTLFKYINERQYVLAMEFSIPINPMQLVACDLLHALVLRRIFGVHLSLTRIFLLGATSHWFERIVAQIVMYVRRNESNVGNQRVFVLHWGPSADSGHWLMQIEGFLIHIFKRGGSIIAEPHRPDSDKDRLEDRVIPSLRASLYVPFRRYGIVGLTDNKNASNLQEEWRDVLEDWMHVEKYSSATRSCQEFVIFAMYYSCHPPFFNMSDLKSLFPPLLCLLLIYSDMVVRASLIIALWFKDDIFQ